MSQATLSTNSTMGDILSEYPSAQRALFQKYHIGGCHSCGYEMTETLGQVLERKGISDSEEIINFILEAAESDKKIQISPQEAAQLLEAEESPRLIDVRMPTEYDMGSIEGADLMTRELAQEIHSWPRSTPFILFCHTGERSLDAASYFAGHGFKNVRAIRGGIDKWAQEIDSKIPRYEITRNPVDGRAQFVPLRSVVSDAEGCMT